MTLKVLYVLSPTKTFAGIERVVDEICSELADQYKNVDVHVLFTSSYSDAPLSPHYTRIQENITDLWDLLRTVRRVVRRGKYDLVVAPQVEATVLFWIACLGLKSRFVLYLHGNPQFEGQNYKGRLLFFLMKWVIIHRLSGVLGTSPKQLQAFQSGFPSSAPHFWVPNPVRRFEAAAPPDRDEAHVTFVKVGRFSHQKGHDLLIRAFHRLHHARPDVRLVLVGYGGGEPGLRAQITALGLDAAARIEHQPHDPGPALRAADVYVSASRWEGWSLAICEALRCGLPVVATDCDFGPSDILIDRRLGRLTPPGDEQALADAMLYYCDNLAAERAQAAYRKAYVERFDSDKVVHLHAQALMTISNGRRPGQRAARPAETSGAAPGPPPLGAASGPSRLQPGLPRRFRRAVPLGQGGLG